MSAIDQRVRELERALLEIRDRHVPAIENNAHEGDKVMCGAGSIRTVLARVVPLCDYPKTTTCACGEPSPDSIVIHSPGGCRLRPR